MAKGLPQSFAQRRGLPIGNLTSQLFANVYMNELDRFIKHVLKVKYYARYTDDFIIVHQDSDYLHSLLPDIQKFLEQNLDLSLHPKKIILRKLTQGADFLGYVVLPYHTALRTKTKRRMFRKLRQKKIFERQGVISPAKLTQTLRSYRGMLKHCRGKRLERILMDIISS